MARDSAAYVVTIVCVVAFIVGTLLLTVLDPIAQNLFASPMWSADTADGQNLLVWMERAFAFFSTAILLAILMQIWIDTRQPT